MDYLPDWDCAATNDSNPSPVTKSTAIHTRCIVGTVKILKYEAAPKQANGRAAVKWRSSLMEWNLGQQKNL